MPTKYNLLLRLISFCLIGTFLSQEISYCAPEGLVSAVPKPLDLVLADPSRFEAPLDFSTLKAVHKGANGKLIIHIQDAHSNISGQQNLASMLDELMEKYGVSLVLSEGGAKDCSLTPVKDIAPASVWKKVARSYLLQGKLSGEEYLNLVSDRPMKIMGLEDLGLYVKSVQSYGALARKREDVLTYLAKAELAIEKLKNKQYPKELLEYEKGKKVGEFESNFRALLALAKTKGTDLAEFSELGRLVELALEEKLIDFNLANLEQASLLERLQERGGGGQLREQFGKLNRSKNQKLSRLAYLENTFSIAKEKNIPLDIYPHLHAYGEYLRHFASLDLEATLDQMEKAEEKVYASVLSGDALVVRSVDRYLALLRTAYRIQMTTKDFNRFQAETPDFPTVSYLAYVNRKLADLGYFEDLVPYQGLFEEGKESLEGFYDSVQKRDFAFLENTEKFLNEENQKAAVLITGGYHTDHLMKLLEDKGYSIAVLTPIVSSETIQAKYEKRLLEPFQSETKKVTAVSGESRKDVSLASLEKIGKKDGVRELLTGLAVNSKVEAGNPEVERLFEVSGARLAALENDARTMAGKAPANRTLLEKSSAGARLADRLRKSPRQSEARTPFKFWTPFQIFALAMMGGIFAAVVYVYVTTKHELFNTPEEGTPASATKASADSSASSTRGARLADANANRIQELEARINELRVEASKSSGIFVAALYGEITKLRTELGRLREKLPNDNPSEGLTAYGPDGKPYSLDTISFEALRTLANEISTSNPRWDSGEAQKVTTALLRARASAKDKPSGARPSEGGPSASGGRLAELRHRNTYSQEAFILPAERFGAEGVDLISSARTVLGRLGIEKGSVVAINGSYNYERDRSGRPIWDMIGDIDLQIYTSSKLTPEQELDLMKEFYSELLRKYGPNVMDVKGIDSPGDFWKYASNSWGVRDRIRGVTLPIQLGIAENSELFDGISHMSYRSSDAYFGDVESVLSEAGVERTVLSQISYYRETLRRLRRRIKSDGPYPDLHPSRLKTAYYLALLAGRGQDFDYLLEASEALKMQSDEEFFSQHIEIALAELEGISDEDLRNVFQSRVQGARLAGITDQERENVKTFLKAFLGMGVLISKEGSKAIVVGRRPQVRRASPSTGLPADEFLLPGASPQAVHESAVRNMTSALRKALPGRTVADSMLYFDMDMSDAIGFMLEGVQDDRSPDSILEDWEYFEYLFESSESARKLMINKISKAPRGSGARLAGQDPTRRGVLKGLAGFFALSPLIACTPPSSTSSQAQSPTQPARPEPTPMRYGAWNESSRPKLDSIKKLFSDFEAVRAGLSAEDAEGAYERFYNALNSMLSEEFRVTAAIWDMGSETQLFMNARAEMASRGALLIYNGEAVDRLETSAGARREFLYRNLHPVEVLLNGRTSRNGVPVAFRTRGDGQLLNPSELGAATEDAAIIILPSVQNYIEELRRQSEQLDGVYPEGPNEAEWQDLRAGLTSLLDDDPNAVLASITFTYARLLAMKPLDADREADVIDGTGVHEGQHIRDFLAGRTDTLLPREMEERARLSSLAANPWSGLLQMISVLTHTEPDLPSWALAEKAIADGLVSEILADPGRYGIELPPGLSRRRQENLVYAQLDKLAGPQIAPIVRRVAERMGHSDIFGARLAYSGQLDPLSEFVSYSGWPALSGNRPSVNEILDFMRKNGIAGEDAILELARRASNNAGYGELKFEKTWEEFKAALPYIKKIAVAIHEKAGQSNPDKLVFLARDAELLYDAYRFFYPEDSRAILLPASKPLWMPGSDRSLAKRFLEQNGIVPDAKLIFIDTGFVGTVPKNIKRLMTEEPGSKVPDMETWLVSSIGGPRSNEEILDAGSEEEFNELKSKMPRTSALRPMPYDYKSLNYLLALFLQLAPRYFGTYGGFKSEDGRVTAVPRRDGIASDIDGGIADVNASVVNPAAALAVQMLLASYVSGARLAAPASAPDIKNIVAQGVELRRRLTEDFHDFIGRIPSGDPSQDYYMEKMREAGLTGDGATGAAYLGHGIEVIVFTLKEYPDLVFKIDHLNRRQKELPRKRVEGAFNVFYFLAENAKNNKSGKIHEVEYKGFTLTGVKGLIAPTAFISTSQGYLMAQLRGKTPDPEKIPKEDDFKRVLEEFGAKLQDPNFERNLIMLPDGTVVLADMGAIGLPGTAGARPSEGGPSASGGRLALDANSSPEDILVSLRRITDLVFQDSHIGKDEAADSYAVFAAHADFVQEGLLRALAGAFEEIELGKDEQYSDGPYVGAIREIERSISRARGLTDDLERHAKYAKEKEREGSPVDRSVFRSQTLAILTAMKVTLKSSIHQTEQDVQAMREGSSSGARLATPTERRNRRSWEKKLKDRIRTLEIELERALAERDAARHEITIDPLTGLRNRRYYNEFLSELLRQAGEEGFPVSVISLDLDRFKEINDSNGHAAGDEVLQYLSRVLKAIVRRETDLIMLDPAKSPPLESFRLGGEEFLIVLPDTSADGAAQVAERIRHALEEGLDWDNPQSEPHKRTFKVKGTVLETGEATDDRLITGSFGVAEWKPGETPDAFIDRADKAMYKAKENRNEVVAWEEETLVLAGAGARPSEGGPSASGGRLASEVAGAELIEEIELTTGEKFRFYNLTEGDKERFSVYIDEGAGEKSAGILDLLIQGERAVLGISFFSSEKLTDWDQTIDGDLRESPAIQVHWRYAGYRGIGRELMRLAMTKALERNAKEMIAEGVYADPTENPEKFYVDLGFKRINEEPVHDAVNLRIDLHVEVVEGIHQKIEKKPSSEAFNGARLAGFGTDWEGAKPEQVDDAFVAWEKESLSVLDRGLMAEIARGKEAILAGLLKDHPEKVFVKAEDEADAANDGRTVYLRLDSPFIVNGRSYSMLRIKGARPRSEIVQPYLGGADYNIKVDATDGILSVEHKPVEVRMVRGRPFVDSEPGTLAPLGVMPLDIAGKEFRMMEEGQRSGGFASDYPVATGVWKGLRYEGSTEVGFVIAAVEGEDIRMAKTENDVPESATLLTNVMTGEALPVSPEEAGAIYEKLGQSLRSFHDSGFFHQQLHPMNIGVRRDPSGKKLEVVLEDFETTVPLDSPGQRIVDLQRVAYYLGRNGFDGENWSFLDSFLQGYFRELSPDSRVFQNLAGAARQRDFVFLIEDLKDSGQKLPLKESSVTRLLWSELDKIAPEKTSGARLAEETAAAPNAKFPTQVVRTRDELEPVMDLVILASESGRGIVPMGITGTKYAAIHISPPVSGVTKVALTDAGSGEAFYSFDLTKEEMRQARQRFNEAPSKPAPGASTMDEIDRMKVAEAVRDHKALDGITRILFSQWAKTVTVDKNVLLSLGIDGQDTPGMIEQINILRDEFRRLKEASDIRLNVFIELVDKDGRRLDSFEGFNSDMPPAGAVLKKMYSGALNDLFLETAKKAGNAGLLPVQPARMDSSTFNVIPYRPNMRAAIMLALGESNDPILVRVVKTLTGADAVGTDEVSMIQDIPADATPELYREKGLIVRALATLSQELYKAYTNLIAIGSSA